MQTPPTAEPPGDHGLRRRRLVPIIGTVVGAAAGYAFYVFFGCDSG